jgi:hypothetical protein
MAELGSTVFVRFEGSLEDLLDVVTSLAIGRRERRTVTREPYKLYVRPNDYRLQQDAGSRADDFLQYPYTVDILADSNDVHLEDYLGFVGQLLVALHAKEMDVVTACDWEDRLPGKGKLVHERPDMAV